MYIESVVLSLESNCSCFCSCMLVFYCSCISFPVFCLLLTPNNLNKRCCCIPRWPLQSITSMERVQWTPSQQLSPQCKEIEGIDPTVETWPGDFEGVRSYDPQTACQGGHWARFPRWKTTNQVHYLPPPSCVWSMMRQRCDGLDFVCKQKCLSYLLFNIVLVQLLLH